MEEKIAPLKSKLSHYRNLPPVSDIIRVLSVDHPNTCTFSSMIVQLVHTGIYLYSIIMVYSTWIVVLVPLLGHGIS